MSLNRLPDYLGHMRDAEHQACVYIEGMDKAGFLDGRRTQQAVIMNLIIIGEAATKLLDGYREFLDQYPDVPWASMKGMRNRIAHGYFDLNLDTVWETLRTSLPQLLAVLPAIHEAAIAQADGNGIHQ